jgi:predicted glycoside hydrolase/deacetylase ChbG (UPF0249 family)
LSLLIVNADDWGADAATTDAIRDCFAAGAVTSVSAMVHMADSARAAALGVDPVGLHLNLSEPFSDPGCPSEVGRRQAALARRFGGPRSRLWSLSPTLFGQIQACVRDQLEVFRQLYGREPTHFDGHHHAHQALAVTLGRVLPRGVKMRPSLTFLPGEKPVHNRAARGMVNRAIHARFRSPHYLFDLREMHPALGGSGLERKLALASSSTVEVMVHPGMADERELLLGGDWARLIAPYRLGSYRDL